MSESTAFQSIDPSFKRKWVAALRSGDYRQNHGSWRGGNEVDGFTYCCLTGAMDLLESKIRVNIAIL